MKDDLRYVWPGWVVSAMPWLALLLIVAGALHVRIGLGRWPEFGAAYNSAAWSLHQFMIVWTTLAAAVVAPPLWFVFLLFRRTRFTANIHAIQATTFLVGWGFIILFGVTDPLGFVGWWMD